MNDWLIDRLPDRQTDRQMDEEVKALTNLLSDLLSCFKFIFLGDIQPLDVCCVRKKNEVLRYNVAMAAYGFFGDVMQDSEKLRWMGPKRYDLSGFKKFMSNRCKIIFAEIA